MSDETELAHDIGHVEAQTEQAQETAEQALDTAEQTAETLDHVVINYVSETEHAALRDRVSELERMIEQWQNREMETPEQETVQETVEETPQETIQETPQEIVMEPPKVEKKERRYLFSHPLNR